MDDYIEREATNADSVGKPPKIKTHFAQIIVGNKTAEKPYYSILYFDPADGNYHIGWGSFCLEYVFKWLSEEFEIIEGAADVAPVVRGEWEPGGMHPNGVVGNWQCSVCSGISLEDSNYCPDCGAKMDG